MREIYKDTGISKKSYYFGARYYDPKISNWISTDPALGEYMPTAEQVFFPEKAFDANSLKGAGGIYNSTNLNVYHYAGLNPLKIIDPDGRAQKKNKDSWVWNILDILTGGAWATATGHNADDPAAVGTETGDAILKKAADFTGLGDIKGILTGTDFSGESFSLGSTILAALPLVSKMRVLRDLGKLTEVNAFAKGGRNEAFAMFNKLAKGESVQLLKDRKSGKIIGLTTESGGTTLRFKAKGGDKKGTFANVEHFDEKTGTLTNTHFNSTGTPDH